MVNGPDDVYVERKGRIERVADRLFEGEEAVLHVIERITNYRLDRRLAVRRRLPVAITTGLRSS